MALDTYAGLLAAIAATLNRSDLTAAIPDFVTMFEADANAELDCEQMVAVNNAFSVSAETVSVPAGFMGAKSFRLATAPVTKLEYRKPDEMDDILDAAAYSAGRPLYYTVVGGSFVFSPVPDATYTARLRYRQQIPALSDDNPTNWLLALRPDAYLYGALMHSAPYLKADARLPVWDALKQKAFSGIGKLEAAISGGSEPRMVARTFG